MQQPQLGAASRNRFEQGTRSIGTIIVYGHQSRPRNWTHLQRFFNYIYGDQSMEQETTNNEHRNQKEYKESVSNESNLKRGAAKEEP